MKPKFFVVLMAAAFLFSGRIYAHHSFAATYFEDKTVTIEGELVLCGKSIPVDAPTRSC